MPKPQPGRRCTTRSMPAKTHEPSSPRAADLKVAVEQVADGHDLLERASETSRERCPQACP
jgi:hypothetical protein